MTEYTPEQRFVASMIRLRKALGLSQTGLADILARRGLPFHQPTVSRVELCERPVRLDEAYVIAEVLQSTVPAMSGDIEAAAQRQVDDFRGRIREIADELSDLARGAES